MHGSKNKQSGNLSYCSGGYRYCKIDKQKLLAFIADKPDAYLYEIAQMFDCSSVAVFKTLVAGLWKIGKQAGGGLAYGDLL